MVPMLTIDEYRAECRAGWQPLVVYGEFFVYDDERYDPPAVSVGGVPLDREEW